MFFLAKSFRLCDKKITFLENFDEWGFPNPLPYLWQVSIFKPFLTLYMKAVVSF